MSKRHIAAVVLSIGIVGFGLATATSGTQARPGELQQTEARHRAAARTSRCRGTLPRWWRDTSSPEQRRCRCVASR